MPAARRRGIAFSGLSVAKIRPPANVERLGRDVEAGARDAGEAIAQLHRREVRGARDRAGEAAGVVPGRNGPGVLLGVELHVDSDVVEPYAEGVGNDLGEDGAVTLALRHRIGLHGNRSDWIDGDGGACRRSVLRTGSCPLLGGQRHGDVAHVGDARLDDGREPDAVAASLGAGGVAARAEPVEASVAGGDVKGGGVVARVEQRACRGPVRERILRDEVPADDVERVELEGLGDSVHEAFEREVHLRPAESPVESGRGLVGKDDAVADFQVRDSVRAGHVAVGTVEGRGFGGAQVCAAVVDLVPAQAGDGAVRGDRCFEGCDPVRGRGRGEEVFKTILHPLDRASRFARGEAHQATM